LFILFGLLFLTACANPYSWEDKSSEPNSKTPSTSNPTGSNTGATTTRGPQVVGVRPQFHVVQSGESFYVIAKRYAMDYRDLASWNNMSTKDVIFSGQKLRLHPPADSSTASANSTPTNSTITTGAPVAKLKLQWPLRGRIINRFNSQDNTVKGIDIGGLSGQRIQAAAAGKVVYSGSGLVGLGNVLIIKHNETYLTAYGYNEKLLFSEGDEVQQGAEIAIIGNGQDNQLMLHFEVRKNGKPVDPMIYLP